MLLLCCVCEVSDVVDENGRCVVDVDVVIIARRSVGDFVNAYMYIINIFILVLREYCV